jgi:hypothetical protein
MARAAYMTLSYGSGEHGHGVTRQFVSHIFIPFQMNLKIIIIFNIPCFAAIVKKKILFSLFRAP